MIAKWVVSWFHSNMFISTLFGPTFPTSTNESCDTYTILHVTVYESSIIFQIPSGCKPSQERNWFVSILEEANTQRRALRHSLYYLTTAMVPLVTKLVTAKRSIFLGRSPVTTAMVPLVAKLTATMSHSLLVILPSLLLWSPWSQNFSQQKCHIPSWSFSLHTELLHGLLELQPSRSQRNERSLCTVELTFVLNVTMQK